MKLVGIISASAITLAGLSASTAQASASSCFAKSATIVGTPGNNVLRGTPGADVIVGLSGNDTIYGGGGNDNICGQKGKDTIYAEDGDYSVYGGKGNDKLFGGTGKDLLGGNAGSDALNGGGDYGDAATFFDAIGPVKVNLTSGKATGFGTDSLTGIANLEGSAYADHLTGAPNHNEIYGLGGNDTIDGGGADPRGNAYANGDYLDGGKGRDTLYGNSPSSGAPSLPRTGDFDPPAESTRAPPIEPQCTIPTARRSRDSVTLDKARCLRPKSFVTGHRADP